MLQSLIRELAPPAKEIIVHSSNINKLYISSYSNKINLPRSFSVVSYSCAQNKFNSISTLSLTPGRCRPHDDIDNDMHELRLSRQDNPFIQVKVSEAMCGIGTAIIF